MSHRTSALILTLCLFGCPADGEGDDAAGTGETDPTSGGGGCTPGEVSPCACPDGTQSQQTCAADGNAFGACACGGSTDSTTTASSSSTTASTTTDPSSTTTGTDEESGGSSDAGSSESGTAAGSSDGPTPECTGSHPIVEGEMRYCEEGNCYCNDTVSPVPSESCFPEDIADACCAVELVCY